MSNESINEQDKERAVNSTGTKPTMFYGKKVGNEMVGMTSEQVLEKLYTEKGRLVTQIEILQGQLRMVDSKIVQVITPCGNGRSEK